MSATLNADIIIIGGGLVGLGAAYKFLEKYPDNKLILIEKERSVAQHQSSHNSGVLHTGIYYKPGSLKAQNCTRGKKWLEEFCEKEGVSHKICGKVIVATSQRELETLRMIYERGVANGVNCALLSTSQLKEIEPHVNGLQAIHVKDAGIVDFPGVAAALVRKIQERGGDVQLGQAVTTIIENSDEIIISTSNKEYRAGRMINAAGLFSDRVLQMARHKPPCKIVPFRGEYYIVKKERDHLCKALVYPVPNPDFPFLGVHYTRGVHGEVECGPNAVLALAREGYNWSNINLLDFIEAITYKGLRKFLAKYWSEAWAEITRSCSKQLFVAALQKLIPDIVASDLEPGPTGVRAQALTTEGALVDDFLIHQTKRALHVLNAPSPAATSCLSIGHDLVLKISN